MSLPLKINVWSDRCHGSQEERKCQDRRPDPNNMEPLRAIDLPLPILGWRAGLPGERGTVDRDGADNPDHDPGEYVDASRTPKPKARCAILQNR